MSAAQLRALRTQIAPAAVASEVTTGLPAELTASQCVLESGWLAHAPGNNCFGIKDTDRYPGVQYQFTKELISGQWRTLKLAFEVYPNLAACFTDHARLITGGFDLPEHPNCYLPAWREFRLTREVEKFVRAIAKYYATDSDYADKVLSLMRSPDVLAALFAARQGVNI